MTKFAMFAALLSLTVLTVGCDKPANKKADLAKPAMPAETEANPADADMDGDKAAETATQKKVDEADADNDDTK